MILFKWHVVKAGPYFFVRKRAWYLLYLDYVYADPNPQYFWDSSRTVLKYCKFAQYESALERCETLNVIG